MAYTKIQPFPAKAVKRVNVVVCSGSLPRNVDGLVQHIKHNMSDVVETVRFESLPYNVRDMNRFDMSGIDVLLLCHSIENRRFSITDVTDSLYDGFLVRAKKCLGRNKVGVIAHDFSKDDLSPDRLCSKMATFRHTQYTTFQCASFVQIGGQLSERAIQLNGEQLDELHRFFCEATTKSLGSLERFITALCRRVFCFVCL